MKIIDNLLEKFDKKAWDISTKYLMKYAEATHREFMLYRLVKGGEVMNEELKKLNELNEE